MGCLSEALGAEQRVGEVDQQPRGHEGSERIVERHDASLQPIAGERVADRQGEQSQAGNQQAKIKHGRPFFRVMGATTK